MRRNALLPALIPAALFGAAGTSLAQLQYSLTKIPYLQGRSTPGSPKSMGNDGSVALEDGGSYAAYYRPDIGTVLVGFDSQRYVSNDVYGNSNGMVVGTYAREGTGMVAGTWNQHTGVTSNWGAHSSAGAINDRNEYLVVDIVETGGVHYVYADGSSRSIGRPQNSSGFFNARAMSDTGYAAGTTKVNNRQTDWISRPGGDAEAIFAPNGYQFADVFAVDDAGNAYGQTDGSAGIAGFIRTIDGSWTLVRNTLFDGAYLFFIDVNRSGLISGVAIAGVRNNKAYYHSVIYRKDLGLIDLNTLLDASGAGWELNGWAYINDKGQISTTARDPSGTPYAVVLNPVPRAIRPPRPYR